MLDVKYHLCVAQEHGVKVEVSPTSNVVPIFGHVRVAAESVSTETTRFESVGTTGLPFLDLWNVFFIVSVLDNFFSFFLIFLLGIWFCLYLV